MPRSYVSGWIYAIKDLKVSILSNNKPKRKLRLKFWRQKLKKKYYWFTPDELVKQTEESFKNVQESIEHVREEFYERIGMENATREVEQPNIREKIFYDFELTGIVETNGITHDDLLDEVIKWVESKGWSYGGSVREVDSESDDDIYDQMGY